MGLFSGTFHTCHHTRMTDSDPLGQLLTAATPLVAAKERLSCCQHEAGSLHFVGTEHQTQCPNFASAAISASMHSIQASVNVSNCFPCRAPKVQSCHIILNACMTVPQC